MRDDQIDIVGRQSSLLHRGRGGTLHHRHRLAEHFSAVHLHHIAVIGIENVHIVAVRTHVPGHQLTAGVRPLDHGRSGAVAEQNAGASIVVVGDPVQGIGPDNQNAVHALDQEAVGHHQAVDPSGTGGLQVKRADENAQLPGDGRWGSPEDVVRGRGGLDDLVDVFRADTSVIQCKLGRVGGQPVGSATDMALPDAGALADLLVVGVHHVGQVIVSEDLVGKDGTDAGNVHTPWSSRGTWSVGGV